MYSRYACIHNLAYPMHLKVPRSKPGLKVAPCLQNGWKGEEKIIVYRCMTSYFGLAWIWLDPDGSQASSKNLLSWPQAKVPEENQGPMRICLNFEQTTLCPSPLSQNVLWEVRFASARGSDMLRSAKIELHFECDSWLRMVVDDAIGKGGRHIMSGYMANPRCTHTCLNLTCHVRVCAQEVPRFRPFYECDRATMPGSVRSMSRIRRKLLPCNLITPCNLFESLKFVHSMILPGHHWEKCLDNWQGRLATQWGQGLRWLPWLAKWMGQFLWWYWQGYMDTNGVVRITGRYKELIIGAGELVFL